MDNFECSSLLFGKKMKNEKSFRVYLNSCGHMVHEKCRD